ncbi:MAG TPA: DsbA family protein [Phenylobacterium sp.]
MNRRALLRSAAGISLATLFTAPLTTVERPAAQPLDVEALLFDPATPTGGNPKGNVTIVAFFDYNCGYCKKASPALEKLVTEDGNIRLVYKDWPILAETSVVGAQMALAAKYQGKYEAAHKALMELRSLSSANIGTALKDAGIDRARLSADLKSKGPEIAALLKRNHDQANALELPGTPVYLVGPYKVAAALDYEGFKKVVNDARERAKAN